MCKMIDQYADKIKGKFSFFDRMIINGYFRPLISEETRIGCLYSLGIPLGDFTDYFKNVTDHLMKQIESCAQELGRPVVYLPSSRVPHDYHCPNRITYLFVSCLFFVPTFL